MEFKGKQILVFGAGKSGMEPLIFWKSWEHSRSLFDGNERRMPISGSGKRIGENCGLVYTGSCRRK